mgnify:CR=1 FL=1
MWNEYRRDVENIIASFGYPCAVISDDIYLKVFIEIPDKISLDMNKMKKEITAKIKELDDAEPTNLLRQERDGKLAETDWVVTKAAETGVAETTAWKTYRQELRDLPAQDTTKWNPKASLNSSKTGVDISGVAWPTEPS